MDMDNSSVIAGVRGIWGAKWKWKKYSIFLKRKAKIISYLSCEYLSYRDAAGKSWFPPIEAQRNLSLSLIYLLALTA